MKTFKTILFTVLFSLIYNTSQTQDNYSVAIENTVIKEVWCNYYSSINAGVYFVDIFTIQGDTIINGIAYKKIYETNEVYGYAFLYQQSTDSLLFFEHSLKGGIRQENGKLYAAFQQFESNMEEKLIFDFNAEPGDTLTIWLDFIGLYSLVIHDITYITVNDGSTRKKYTLREQNLDTPIPNLYWIEGVGSNFGLFKTDHMYISDQISHIRCFAQANIHILDEIPEYSDDCLTIPIVDCKNLVTSLSTSVKSNFLSVFPNPAQNQITVIAPLVGKSIDQMMIYNQLGVLVHSSFPQNIDLLHIELNNFVPGIYILQLFSEQQLFSSRFVVE